MTDQTLYCSLSFIVFAISVCELGQNFASFTEPLFNEVKLSDTLFVGDV